MASKKYDIAVKTGEYKNASGETKGRYQNVGAVIEGDNGPYIMLERWFNPAGIANPDNRGNVILSLFKPSDKDGNNQANNIASNNVTTTTASPGIDDDSIPF